MLPSPRRRRLLHDRTRVPPPAGRIQGPDPMGRPRRTTAPGSGRPAGVYFGEIGCLATTRALEIGERHPGLAHALGEEVLAQSADRISEVPKQQTTRQAEESFRLPQHIGSGRKGAPRAARCPARGKTGARPPPPTASGEWSYPLRADPRAPVVLAGRLEQTIEDRSSSTVSPEAPRVRGWWIRPVPRESPLPFPPPSDTAPAARAASAASTSRCRP